MITKQDLITYFRQEVPITIKVLKAVPSDQLAFKPHDKSNSIQQLIVTFAGDLVMAESFAQGIVPENTMSKIEQPLSVEAGINLLQEKLDQLCATLESLSDEDVNQQSNTWCFEKTRAEFVLWLLFDHIHHRGQLSVYVRLAGGLVPSIYGPSADEGMM